LSMGHNILLAHICRLFEAVFGYALNSATAEPVWKEGEELAAVEASTAERLKRAAVVHGGDRAAGREEAALAAHRAQQPVAPSVGARQARRRGIAQRGIGAARQERTSDMIACQPVTGLPGTREARLAHLGERTVRTGGAGGGKGGDEADLPPGAV